jgi:UPF0176 protein
MTQICAFYTFKPLVAAELRQLQMELENMATNHDLRGLVLIGREGINFTISGSSTGVEAFKAWLTGRLDLQNPIFKDSFADRHPFHIFKVKIKREIVSLGNPELVPTKPQHHHISPSEWREKMRSGALVLDTRNDYEFEIGRFENAKELGIREFHDFPARLKAANLPKDQEVLIYCTGGIRCEKAILEMERQGFSRVFQLDGGILNYIKEYPNDGFEGECFVFDYCVAVDQELKPTHTYKLCAHCGQASATELECSLCHQAGIVCHHCSDKGINTCSKNCAHHARLGSTSTRPHVQELRKRHRL